jgi:hypothetical protein
MKPVLFAFLLTACLDSLHPVAHDLCGDPPLIGGIATFLTEIWDQPYICATAESDHQRALEISLTRQWEQCMTEAREASGTLAVTLIAARRDRNVARAAVTSWMTSAGARGEVVHAEQAPGWTAYEQAEAAWRDAITKVDGWMAGNKRQP